MSKLLTRLLKTSMLPAATMVVAKLVGLYFAISIYDMGLYIGNEVENIFSVQILIDDAQSTLIANSLSDLSLLVVMTLVSTYLMIKYTLYTKTLDNPRTIVKLSKLNLLKWVTDKDTVFVKIFVWTLFLFASTATIITNTLNGDTYEWIGATAFVVSIIFMWGLVRSFDLEIEKIYPKETENALY